MVSIFPVGTTCAALTLVAATTQAVQRPTRGERQEQMPMWSRRHLILALAGSAVALTGRPLRALAMHLQHTPPPPMVLRSASGEEQEGGIGAYCWDSQCADMQSTPFPSCPLAISEGEALTLDVSALGQPSGLDFSVWNTEEDDLDGEPAQSGNIDVEATGDAPISFPVDLPPGQFAVEIFAQFGTSGDSLQGFMLHVLPASGAVTPEDSAVSTPSNNASYETPGGKRVLRTRLT